MSGGTDDYDELLRQVEASLSPSAGAAKPPAESAAAKAPAPKRASAPQTGDDDQGSALGERLVGGLIAGAVAGGAVWVLFLLLPLMSSFSGAVGAFLAAFVVWVVRGR